MNGRTYRSIQERVELVGPLWKFQIRKTQDEVVRRGEYNWFPSWVCTVDPSWVASATTVAALVKRGRLRLSPDGLRVDAMPGAPPSTTPVPPLRRPNHRGTVAARKKARAAGTLYRWPFRYAQGSWYPQPYEGQVWAPDGGISDHHARKLAAEGLLVYVRPHVLQVRR